MGAGQPNALAEIARQSENVRAAWDWAVDHAGMNHGYWPELERASLALFLFYYMRSWFHEGEAAFGRLIDALAGQGAAGTEALFGQALASQGWFVFLTGHDRTGLSLVRPQPVPAPRRERTAGAGLQPVLSQRDGAAPGGYRRPRTRLAQKAWPLRGVEDRYGIATACNILGRAAHRMGDTDEARRQCQRNLEIARELGNQWSMAFSLELLGRIALAQADADTAGRHFTECLAIRRADG